MFLSFLFIKLSCRTTLEATPNEVGDAVKNAIDIGYRHFDCAMLYVNETEIGAAIREKIAEGIVKRSELFIVTKLWNVHHDRELVVPTCRKSLNNFGLEYIDQYLIHWPVALEHAGFNIKLPFSNPTGKDYDYIETWKGMEECFKLGLTRGIGLSNFNSRQIQRVLDSASIKPVVNQVEAHPLLNQKKLRKFCKKHDIAITGYAPLGSSSRKFAKPEDPVLCFDDPRLLQIGRKYGKTGAQIVLRYLIDIGITPLPKSVNYQRLVENISLFDFELSADEIKIMDTFDCNGRLFTADEFKDFAHYPFKDEY